MMSQCEISGKPLRQAFTSPRARGRLDLHSGAAFQRVQYEGISSPAALRPVFNPASGIDTRTSTENLTKILFMIALLVNWPAIQV